jgi:hypothetical protein
MTRTVLRPARRGRLATVAVTTGALLAAGLATALAPAQAVGTDLAPYTFTGQPQLVHRWAALNQVKHEKLTKAQITSLANNVDLVVVKNTDARTVSLMKSTNPRLVALVYANGAFAQKNEGTRFPESWYARDAAGNKITMPKFGNYLMDISSQGWIDQVVATCLDYKAQSGADGCYSDMLMTAPLFNGYVSAKPINPATGKVWSFKDYQAQVGVIADAVRNGGGGPNAANGVANGNRWFVTGGGSSKPITDHANAAHSEIWIRDRSLTVSEFPPATQWQQDVDMVAEAEAEGRVLMIETKLWPKGGEPAPTSDLVQQWRGFTLASYLLGTEGRYTWFLFDVDRTYAGMTTADPWDNAPIGAPAGPYSALANGAFVRSYSTGFVAVNPGATPLVVSLPSGSWQRVGGSTESGDVTLAAHSGAIWSD